MPRVVPVSEVEMSTFRRITAGVTVHGTSHSLEEVRLRRVIMLAAVLSPALPSVADAKTTNTSGTFQAAYVSPPAADGSYVTAGAVRDKRFGHGASSRPAGQP